MARQSRLDELVGMRLRAFVTSTFKGRCRLSQRCKQSEMCI